VLTVPLRSRRRRRALAVQKFQHAVPAVPLLFAGVAGLQSGERGAVFVLSLFEIGTSVLLLGTIVRAIKSARNRTAAAHGSHNIDWFHVFAAGVLLAEALEHWHLTAHWRRPTLLMALVTLGLGLLHGRLERRSEARRSLRIDDAGVFVGGRPFSAFHAAWSELASIDVDARRVRIVTKSGRTRELDLTDLENADRVRAALEGARQRIETLA
jgi:hypothetical protein